MEKFQVCNSLVAADRSHTSLIEVTERPRLFAVDHSQNIASCVTTLLHRHRRDSWQRLSSLMREACKVANYLHFRMSRNREVVVHNDSPNPINWRYQRLS